jgi:hypothetical protein
MEQRISMIALGVHDLKKSVHFYEHGLGWKKSSESSDQIAFFQLNGLAFSLYPHDLLAEDATVSAHGEGFQGFTLGYNTKSEEEVDQVLKHAESIGGRIVKPGQKVFWGGYSGYFADPDGFLWEVAYNPFFPFDENNNIKLP